MVFSGTLDKCKACDKTVYIMDLVTADSIPYHKTCFKCAHCNGKLVMGRYSSLDGILYCTPHFEQLFKETGSYGKIQKSKSEKSATEMTKAATKFSAMFSGTQDKCFVCKKTAYPLEKLVVEGENYHKSCFRCAKGGCFLTASNYAALDGILYCKPHFAQLFKEKGSYNHLSESMKGHVNAVAADEQPAEAAADEQAEASGSQQEEEGEATEEKVAEEEEATQTE